MKTVYRRSPSSYIPDYGSNAIIQLIIASGVGFVLFHAIRVIMLMMGSTQEHFFEAVQPNIALPALPYFKAKIWTIFTYGWVHSGFWELASNMIWLYCFGSVVQSLVGYKQIIPLYIYSLTFGGIFYLLVQFIPGNLFQGHSFIMGAQAGLMGLAIAAYTLAPKYRYFLGPSLSFPILLVLGIFTFLMLMNTGMQLSMVCLLIGGGLTGFLYVKLLRSGYRPGEWMYDVSGRIEKIFTPNEHAIWVKHSKKRTKVLSHMYEPKQGISQRRIDDILDKINQHGYNALTSEEKDILLRASKEKD